MKYMQDLEWVWRLLDGIHSNERMSPRLPWQLAVALVCIKRARYTRCLWIRHIPVNSGSRFPPYLIFRNVTVKSFLRNTPTVCPVIVSFTQFHLASIYASHQSEKKERSWLNRARHYIISGRGNSKEEEAMKMLQSSASSSHWLNIISSDKCQWRQTTLPAHKHEVNKNIGFLFKALNHKMSQMNTDGRQISARTTLLPKWSKSETK